MCVFLNVWKILMLNSFINEGIPSVSYYSVPLHLQPVFKNLGHQVGDFPITEKVSSECLSLPMSPYLSAQDQSQVIDKIFYNFKNYCIINT